jgi:site-specific DNA recombinase
MRPGSTGRAAVQNIQVVLYARVSSKDQEKEGFSIPAQLRLLREYAASKSFAIGEEFIDVETAKEGGRTKFNQMLSYLRRRGASCRTILVEKTDRLYRNIKDYATIDELDLEVHLVKENQIISRESRSSEQLMHGIRVMMARNYSQNLGEETVKGMTEKARAGIYPSFAPVGYRNADGSGGKRVIVTDPEAASVIRELFARFDSGRYSLRGLVKELNGEGLHLGNRKLHSSLVHQILRKRLYTGDFDWDGATYNGTHEPLVSRAVWERVQLLLNARAQNKIRRVKHDFAFTGLVRCGHCGCHLVGELKKSRYVYYHCTGNRGKCQEPYTRQETLTDKFAGILKDLVIPRAMLEWLSHAVLDSDRTEQAAREQSVKRLQTRYEQLRGRIETMYLDKLDGRITQELFDRQAAVSQSEQDTLLDKIRDIQKATPAPVDQAIDLMSLTSRACELFLQQPATEQRRLLQVVVKRASWQNRALQTTLFEPFEILRHSNEESERKERQIEASGRDLAIWLLR